MPYSNDNCNDGVATKLMLYKALLNALKQNKKEAKNNHLRSICLGKGLQQLWGTYNDTVFKQITKSIIAAL